VPRRLRVDASQSSGRWCVVHTSGMIFVLYSVTTQASGTFSPAMPSAATCANLQALAWRHRQLAQRRAHVHPLVLKSAAGRDSSGFITREGRLGSWQNVTRIFHMTHIAKTGGRSVRLELLRLVRPVGGAEQCYAPFAHESRINIMFLREPRGHALSMYLHGAYAGRTARRRAAGYPIVPGNDLAGFTKWVQHFGHDWAPTKGARRRRDVCSSRALAASAPLLLSHTLQVHASKHCMRARLGLGLRLKVAAIYPPITSPPPLPILPFH
jgi:hypothetical protein